LPPMQSFNSRLIAKITAADSHLCVGLDISPEKLGISNTNLEALINHTKLVIDATRDLAVAFKPNLAFFERWGSEGFRWLEETMEYLGSDAIVIGDAKRGDIGNTARQYRASLFDHFGFDAVTINPYLGRDSILPFIEDQTKGIFILCRTSNPSAGDLQDQVTKDGPLYARVAGMALDLNQNDNVGLVVGATAPDEIETIRKIAPGLPFLIPGIGAQGGDLAEAFNAGNRNGQAIINVSRAISFAGDLSRSSIRRTARDYRDKMRELNHD